MKYICCGVAVILVFVSGGAFAEECAVLVRPGESIQAALDEAPAGAVLCLEEGRWREHIIVSKPVEIRGLGEVILRGPTRESDVLSTTADLVVRNVTVMEGRNGISATGRIEVTIANCEIRGNAQSGILLERDVRGTVEGCTITRNWEAGITAEGSVAAPVYVTIRDSRVVENLKSGVALYCGFGDEEAVIAEIRNSEIVGHRMQESKHEPLGDLVAAVNPSIVAGLSPHDYLGLMFIKKGISITMHHNIVERFYMASFVHVSGSNNDIELWYGGGSVPAGVWLTVQQDEPRSPTTAPPDSRATIEPPTLPEGEPWMWIALIVILVIGVLVGAIGG